MRIANVGGRAKVVVADKQVVDVASASGGRFGPGLAQVYAEWCDFVEWAGDLDADKAGAVATLEPFSASIAGPPSPAPRQVFAVALNYRDHAAESGFKAPDDPLFFTKFLSAFSGPVTEVLLPEGNVDWECELVAVIGKAARRVAAADAWWHVAGVTVGQDISERKLQRSGPSPQYSLAKSYPGFAPTGPVLVTPDELDDPDDLAIGCDVNDQVMQSARTSDMIFPVGDLIEYLSHRLTLFPGDVIFTGTPPGVGMGRDPQVFLKAGDRLCSHIEGVGEMLQTFTSR